MKLRKGVEKKVLGNLICSGYRYLEKYSDGVVLVNGMTIILYNYEKDEIVGCYTFHCNNEKEPH